MKTIWLLVLCLLASPGFATIYYTDNGSSGCSTPSDTDYDPSIRTCGFGSSTVYNTLQAGANALSAGDILYVRNGTYPETVTLSTDGSEGSEITLQCYTGETCTVDGEYARPSHWGRLVELYGDYIIWNGIDIYRSNSIGLTTTGDHCQILNVDSSYNYENGILVWGSGGGGGTGDYTLVDNCTSTYDCYERVLGDLHSDGNWSSCISITRGADHSTIQNCTVSFCSGESLSMYTYSEGGNTYNTIQDNVAYHTGPPAVYVQNCRNCTVQRNLLYANTMLSGSNLGIYMQDEYASYLNSDNLIINNFIKGFNRNFAWYHAQTSDGLINTTIANNTFVNASSTANFLIGGSGSHSNTVIKNNIFLQEDSTAVMNVPSSAGLTFGYNNYDDSQSNVDDDAEGTGDNYSSDPLLEESGSTGDGQLGGEWFKIGASSPCRDDGTTISAVTEDYFETARPVNGVYDIGAHEYVGPANMYISINNGLFFNGVTKK